MNYHLDDKYTDGVWYDQMAGEFCQIREVGDTIGLFEPNVDPDSVNTNSYYTFDQEGYGKEDAIGKVNADFRKVSEQAVEDPVSVVNRAVQILARNDINELSGLPMDFAVDLRYARNQVKISEKYNRKP